MDDRLLERRRALGLGAGALVWIAGCSSPAPAPNGDRSGRITSRAPQRSTLSFTTVYPTFGTHYDLRASERGAPSADSIGFPSLSRESRIEVATATVRTGYPTRRSAFLDSEQYGRPVVIAGTTFDVDISVADVFGEVEHGPGNDPDWRAPVSFAGRIDGASVEIAVTNELDTTIAFEHAGQPGLGVVPVVGATDATLSHDAYEQNPAILTDGLVRLDRDAELDRTWLAPGESVSERYGLPDALQPAATICLTLGLSAADGDPLGGRPVTVVATSPLAADG